MVKIPSISAYESLQKTQAAIKRIGKNPTLEDYRTIREMADNTCNIAQQEINEKFKNNRFAGKIDKGITKFFEIFSKLFNKKGGYKTDDMAKTLINTVLIGNILKDLMTGIISTSQSFTNPDYSKEKRMFMGSYDIMACLTTIILSFILGPMSVNKINSIYKNILKPIEKSPKYNFVLSGLSGFTAIVLQSIVAKRAIAPAVSTPLAGIMKNYLLENDKNNSQNNTKKDN